MSTPACQEFVRFWTQDQKREDGLKSDQIAVIKDGQTVYEWTDGVYQADTPHCLWSASKTVGALVAATAIQEGKLSLDEKLASFFPPEIRTNPGPNEKFYDQIRVSDLFEMGAGFDWKEAYDGDIRNSSILAMVYLSGSRDMAYYALQAPLLANGPGKQWVYSGGDSNILQAILKKKYGSDYDNLPWKNLFDKIGMKTAIFEQDAAGTFVGSSYVHASARDMARLGSLLLNDGVWNGERILPEGWMRYMTEVSPPLLQPDTPPKYIVDEGVFGRTIWLNRDVRSLGVPFPHSPQDMYFAAGHYGQLIYMLPSQKVVIARTGHDKEYWSKIDAMISRAVACFGDEK